MTGAEVFCIERAKGQAFGATIVGGFGAAWLAFGMTEVGVPLKVGFALVLPVFVLIAFLGAAVRRRVPRVKKEESPEKQQMMRAFAAVNVVQWVAIFGVVNLLHNLHLDGWITGSIVLIVGVHFLPLAPIFRASQHERTGWALMLLALVSIVVPGSMRDVVECVGAGLILWASAAAALRSAFQMTAKLRLDLQTST
ncbi:MAG TPA: hypothetical protein VF126_13270 [Acidobacteriaceae bacterium]